MYSKTRRHFQQKKKKNFSLLLVKLLSIIYLLLVGAKSRFLRNFRRDLPLWYLLCGSPVGALSTAQHTHCTHTVQRSLVLNTHRHRHTHTDTHTHTQTHTQTHTAHTHTHTHTHRHTLTSVAVQFGVDHVHFAVLLCLLGSFGRPGTRHNVVSTPVLLQTNQVERNATKLARPAPLKKQHLVVVRDIST